MLLGQHQFPASAGLFDNVLSDYLWARAVLLTGSLSFILVHVPIDGSFIMSSSMYGIIAVAGYDLLFRAYKLPDTSAKYGALQDPP